MEVKNRIFTSVSSFIHAVEELELELDRSQHETAFLASNILRRALDRGLDPNIRVSVEFKLSGSSRPMDVVLFGENSTNTQLLVFVLEFKQWSEIKHVRGNTFEAHMYGEKETKFDFNVGKCPYKQVSDYTNLFASALGGGNVRSGLIFPNMKPVDMPNGFVSLMALSTPQIDYFDKSRIEGLCDGIINFLTNGVSQSHSTIDQHELVANSNLHATYSGDLSTSIPVTQLKKRHGWVGTVAEFLRGCLENSLIDEFDDESISMRRSIQFSTNHLAVSIRKLSNLNATLVDQMVVIIEFGLGMGGKKVDAVLAANTGDPSTPLAMYAIEMKGWSSRSKDTFEIISQSMGSDPFPSSVKYKAKRGSMTTSLHPILQVRGYIQDLQFEFGSKIHGCAWLHNIQDSLMEPFSKLTIYEHITMGEINVDNKKKVFTCFDLDGVSIPLHTKRQMYSPTLENSPKVNKVEKQIHISIFDFFSNYNLGDFDLPSLKLLCNSNPTIGKKPITDAFQNSKNILQDVLDRHQKNIAKRVINDAKDAIKSRLKGRKPKTTVLSINGDAGTGKTFIALAAIGQILHAMTVDEQLSSHAISSPKLICLNNPAADLISKTCRSPLADSRRFNLNSNFIISRQNFNSNSQYFLTSLLVRQWECENDPSLGIEKPPLLIFDESQLQSEYSDAGQMTALSSDALRTHGVVDNVRFKQWLRERNLIFVNDKGQETSWIRTDLESLSRLADVTVFFYDSKQATRCEAIRNLNPTSFASLKPNRKLDHRSYELKKSYRSDHQFLRMLKEVLYGKNIHYLNPLLVYARTRKKLKEPKEKVRLYFDETEFIDAFTQKISCEPSTGLVAGYTNFWKSRSDDVYDQGNVDFEGLGGRDFHWNKSPGRSWIMSSIERQDHVGWFLAVQGNELDHVFVYIGKDINTDATNQRLVAEIKNHQPDSDCLKSKTASIEDKEQCILNQYWVLLTRWRESCSIYCENEDVGRLVKEKLQKYGL